MSPDRAHLPGIATMLEMRCPGDLDPHAAGKLAAGLVAWCGENNVNGPSDWPAALDLVDLVWKHTPVLTYPVPESGAAEPPTGGGRAALAVACDRANAGELADVPLPPNPHLVSRYHETVMFKADRMVKMTPADAVLLGVWLIALADPELKVAPRMLAKVATR